jgi:hypothetical protein
LFPGETDSKRRPYANLGNTNPAQRLKRNLLRHLSFKDLHGSPHSHHMACAAYMGVAFFTERAAWWHRWLFAVVFAVHRNPPLIANTKTCRNACAL